MQFPSKKRELTLTTAQYSRDDHREIDRSFFYHNPGMHRGEKPQRCLAGSTKNNFRKKRRYAISIGNFLWFEIQTRLA